MLLSYVWGDTMPLGVTVLSETKAAEGFLGLLRKSGLIEQAHLAKLLSENDSLGRMDPTSAAKFLIQRKLLTTYQAKHLLAGKYKGFFLGPYKILEPIGK